eukprot:Pompholyxophrys_sp_v1_NODE_26_length_3750_cov_7.232206.p3 type:complete len:148 gc:universal NODE_26_length_3750_cov_7.232206:2600-3043(+)
MNYKNKCQRLQVILYTQKHLQLSSKHKFSIQYFLMILTRIPPSFHHSLIRFHHSLIRFHPSSLLLLLLLPSFLLLVLLLQLLLLLSSLLFLPSLHLQPSIFSTLLVLFLPSHLLYRLLCFLVLLPSRLRLLLLIPLVRNRSRLFLTV